MEIKDSEVAGILAMLAILRTDIRLARASQFDLRESAALAGSASAVEEHVRRLLMR